MRKSQVFYARCSLSSMEMIRSVGIVVCGACVECNAYSYCSLPECLSLLQKLNILGRQPQDADAIFTSEVCRHSEHRAKILTLIHPQGIDTLCRFGLDRSSIEISRVALRCLANATLLRPHTRQIIVDHGQASRILTLYKNVSHS